MPEENQTNGVTDPNAQRKLTAQALEAVRDDLSNTEYYLQHDQNFERISLGLESRPRDIQAFCQEWNVRWDEASRE